MSNQGQGLLSHFYLGFVCCVVCLYEAQISGEGLQDHWSSGFAYAIAGLHIVLFYIFKSFLNRIQFRIIVRLWFFFSFKNH